MNQVILNSKPYYFYEGIYIDSFITPHNYEDIVDLINNQLKRIELIFCLSNKPKVILLWSNTLHSSYNEDIIYLKLNDYLLSKELVFTEYDHIKEDPDIGSSLFCSKQEYITRELCHEYSHFLCQYLTDVEITKNYHTDDSSHNDVWQSIYHKLVVNLLK